MRASTSTFPILLAAALGLGLLSATAGRAQTAPQTTAAPPGRHVTVVGHGEARGRPDMARVVLGVETRADTAQAALTQNNQKVRGVMQTIREAGIADRDVQTSRVSIDPVYTQPGERGGEPRLSGYQVVNQVVVTVRNVDALGSLLDRAVRGGANQVLGLSFELSNEEALLNQARTDAMARARTAAAQLAQLAGAQLGAVHSIREMGAVGPGPMEVRTFALSADRGVPVQPGEREVTFDVEVTYTLR